MKANYHVRYKLATGGVFGWEVSAVLQAPSLDDAWQDACATLDELIPSFDDRNLQVERVKAPDKTATTKKPSASHLTDIGFDILRELQTGAKRETALAEHFGVPRPTMRRACCALERSLLVNRDRQRPLTWRLSTVGQDRLASRATPAQP